MRTYDDSFSGQRIYPGKVRWLFPPENGPIDDEGPATHRLLQKEENKPRKSNLERAVVATTFEIGDRYKKSGTKY